MPVLHQRNPVVCCTQEHQAKVYKRQAPHRKHFYSWVATDKKQLEATERLLLRGLPYYQAQIAGLNTISTDDICACNESLAAAAASADGKRVETAAAALSPVSPTAMEADTRDVLLLVHGFAGGLAGWAQNWRFFAEHYRVYAIDLPGFARSERRAHRATSVPEAMDFVCGYLERWFQRLDFKKPVIVVAHSFGCFVAAHYAMRCGASQIKQICFTEPWGVMRGNRDSVKKSSITFRLLLTLFYHVSPLALLRAAGPGGPQLLRHTRPDFEEKWKAFLENTTPVYDYLYHCNAQRSPVGETLFQACCHRNVCAKEPLQDVLPFKLDKRIRVAFLFGGESWLESCEAVEMASVMLEKGFHVLIDTLPTAGHQIFTDDVKGFNEKTLSLLRALATCPDRWEPMGNAGGPTVR
ncbi:hypothetical protein ABL78_5447 [Leptomonas seymouri]|uniref:AB hydrolase-1 domain-containing protein n=1 Tax=Leptomonas seymouri TaxID=5684 RepID=A0A0N0P520_LEPSE|nr:hypothetical protein ABL78_5447 [Leptomonas seymouri]|eukprot:KPI85487.1 hypothetical protein ABL78_5447 [Leptomonas seymouri]